MNRSEVFILKNYNLKHLNNFLGVLKFHTIKQRVLQSRELQQWLRGKMHYQR
jgi:hypothetical protein